MRCTCPFLVPHVSPSPTKPAYIKKPASQDDQHGEASDLVSPATMTTPLRANFLSFNRRAFAAEDEMDHSPIQPHIDTLFAEFTRSRRRMSRSRSRSPVAPRRSQGVEVEQARPTSARTAEDTESQIDLRALDYVSDYDSHLMCPICHVPFVDPLVLDCDHTFCRACFDEYRDGAVHSERSQCPTCRAYLLARPHKASRLIVNMCNDIHVRCPNEDCEEIHPRGCLVQHATRDCPETRLPCPDASCAKLVKRKNFVPSQCIHSSHIECDCGAVIELGRGEWLKHKDENCPTTGVKCDVCNERISVKDYLAGRNAHVCKAQPLAPTCPGADFGCTDQVTLETVDQHTQSCPLARLAPHLLKQSQLLSSLSSQLHLTKVRNEVLETGLDKVSSLLHDQVLPSLPPRPGTPSDHDLDIEEIPRHPPPTARSPGLSLPAHLRPLTPDFQPSSQEIYALHNNLQDSITSLSTTLTSLQQAVSELDARTSMTMMNETLRLKEDLAHQSAGLFSTRAQVQWLLNRERERMVSMRGRPEQTITQGVNAATNLVAGSTRSSVSGEGGADLTGNEGSRTSPMMTAANMLPSPRVRPVMRRLSGSQERVKL